MPPHLASSMSSSSNSHNMMLLRPSNDNNNNSLREDNNIDNKSSDYTNTNMLRATINNTPTDTGTLRPVLSFSNLFNRDGHSNNQKVQPNNNNKRSNSTPVLNNSASTNSMKQQWPCDLSLSNSTIYHTSMQNYNNYDSDTTESNSMASGHVSSASVASTSDIDKSDTTERASNTNAMDIFLSKAGINKQQQSKLQSMRLQQKQGMLQQNNNQGGIQHVQLNDMKSKTQLNNNNTNSILSRMVMVGSGDGDTNNNNNNNGMPIRIAIRQSQGNSGSSSRNSSINNLRQSNRSSISSGRSRSSISRLNSRSSLGSVPENNVSTQNLSNSQWSVDRPDNNNNTSNQHNQGGKNGNEVYKDLTRRRSSNISSASQPNLRQQGGSGGDRSTGSGSKNEQWSDPQDMVKAAGQKGEDIFAKLQELRLQKQIVMEKKEAVLKNSTRWSQPELLNQMGSSMRGLNDSIKGIGGSAIDKNEEWPSSSPEEKSQDPSPSRNARPVFQRDDKIDEIITLKLKIANQQATIDTLSSKLKTTSQDVKKPPEVSQKTIKELEAEKQSLTKQVHECQMREYKLVKELKAQQDDHEREMKQMEEKNQMLRKALDEALNSQQQKSSISSGGSSRSRGSRRKTSLTQASDDNESEDEDLAFNTDEQLDDSTKNKSYAWY